MNERACGECSLCCYTHGVQGNNFAIFKKPREFCVHCPEGKSGCAVYGTPAKPLSCDTFTCLWLDGMGTEDDRPDKLGLLGTMDIRGDEIRKAKLTETKAGALESEFARVVTVTFLLRGVPVFYENTDEELVVVVPVGYTLPESFLSAVRTGFMKVEYMDVTSFKGLVSSD